MTYTDTHALRGAFVANLLGRLVELIARQGDELLQDADITVPSRAVSCMLFVGDKVHASAADIAKSLNQPHQLVSQRVDVLIGLGFLERVSDPEDRRRKILVLTQAGNDQYRRLCARLAEAEQAFGDLFADIGCDLIDLSEQAIIALDNAPLLHRIRANASKNQ